MSDSLFNGYVLDTHRTRPDVNAPGGASPMRLIAIAKSEADAIEVARRLRFPGYTVLESGPAILARARAYDVNDNDARILSD